MNHPKYHADGCDYHFDQYPWECTCMKLTEEQKAACAEQSRLHEKYKHLDGRLTVGFLRFVDGLESENKKLRECLDGALSHVAELAHSHKSPNVRAMALEDIDKIEKVLKEKRNG